MDDKLRHSRTIDLAGLGGLWILVAFVVDPRGDFPLIDDWAYALPVEHLLETGALRFTSWQSMPLLPQVLWGALFALPAGFSFTALRISTLTLGAVAIASQYLLMREVGADRATSRLAALSLLANPVFLTLSFTFMTDVPFLALALLSVTCLFRGLERNAPLALALGFVFAALATLLRQVGLAIPVAFCVAAALRWGLGRRLLLAAGLPSAAVAVGLVGYERALAAAGILPALYPMRSEDLALALLDLVHLRLGALRYPLERGVQALLYTGLFALPLALPLANRGWKRIAPVHRRGVAVGIGSAALVSTAALVALGVELPRFGNVLVDFGVGVPTLAGPRPSAWASWVWWAATALSLVSGGVVVAMGMRTLVRIARRPLDLHGTGVLALITLVPLIYLGPLLLAYGPSFERYFLLPASFAMVLAARGTADLGPVARPIRVVAGLVFALLLAVSTAGVHDYLAWNRARYAAANWLSSAEDAREDQIDAGFEFGSWRESRKALRRGDQGGRVDRADVAYAVVFWASEGERVLGVFPCNGWLPGAPSAVFAVRRDKGSSEAEASP